MAGAVAGLARVRRSTAGATGVGFQKWGCCVNGGDARIHVGVQDPPVAIAVTAAAIILLFQVAFFPNSMQALWQSVINAGGDISVTDRTSDYIRVSQTFHDFPVFGIGLGGSVPSEYGFLDNQWLRAIVEGGSVGLAAMIVLAGGGIFGISAALRCATISRERDQAYAMGAILVAVFASSFTFDLFQIFPKQALYSLYCSGCCGRNSRFVCPKGRKSCNWRTIVARASIPIPITAAMREP